MVYLHRVCQSRFSDPSFDAYRDGRHYNQLMSWRGRDSKEEVFLVLLRTKRLNDFLNLSSVLFTDYTMTRGGGDNDYYENNECCDKDSYDKVFLIFLKVNNS